MSKEKALNFLDTFDYQYEIQASEIIVYLDLHQKVILNFSPENNIRISDKLTRWNFLTGIVEMKLKQAILYNFFGCLIVSFLFMWIFHEGNNLFLLPFLLIIFLWIVFFSFYYQLQLESFKTRILIYMK